MRSSKRVGLAAAAVIAAILAFESGTKVLAQVRPVRAVDALAGRGSEIGVSIRDIERDDNPARGAAAGRGVEIEEVSPEGPADKAGFKKGDVVVEFDGEKVRSVRQFIRLVDETPAGRRVAAAVLRGGQRVELNVEPRPNSGVRLLSQIDAARVMRDLGRQFEDGFSVRGPAPSATCATCAAGTCGPWCSRTSSAASRFSSVAGLRRLCLADRQHAGDQGVSADRSACRVFRCKTRSARHLCRRQFRCACRRLEGWRRRHRCQRDGGVRPQRSSQPDSGTAKRRRVHG